MSYVVFCNSLNDVRLSQEVVPHAPVLRVPLRIARGAAPLAGTCSIWVDAGIDGFGRPQVGRAKNEDWTAYVRQFDEHAVLDDSPHLVSRRGRLASFVTSVCEKLASTQASYLSVPQVPFDSGGSYWKKNQALAQEFGAWRAASDYAGAKVLPVIVEGKSLYLSKPLRRKLAERVASLCSTAGADSIWIVDSRLEDQAGTGDFHNIRFPAWINLVERVRELAPDQSVIAGPHWCLSLILWCRGLAELPGAGIGNVYRYQLPAGVPSPGKVRLALPPLRRWAVKSGLHSWVKRAISRLSAHDAARKSLLALDTNWNLLAKEAARRQVATYYTGWVDELAAADEASRALLLYQQLSSAYVLGKTLPDLSDQEKSAREPARVAMQHMFNCL